MISHGTLVSDPMAPASAAELSSRRPRLLAWHLTDRGAHITPPMLAALAIATELAVLATIALVAAPSVLGDRNAMSSTVAAAMMVLGPVCGLHGLGLYHRHALTASIARVLPSVAMALLLAATMATALAGLTGFDLSPVRADLATWLIASAAGLLATRLGLASLARHWAARGRLDRRTAIYGAGAACADLIRALEADPSCDAAIVGICDDRGGARVGTDVLGYPHIGGLDALIAMARQSRIDTVLVTLPVAAEQRLLQLLERLSVLPADVRQPAAGSVPEVRRRPLGRIGTQTMRALADKPIAGWGLLTKSTFDKLVAALALALAAPLLAVIALAIKLDSRGPVLFRQKRYGFNNELIDVLKFRSMYVELADAKAERLVTRGDPRVTRVGRFIRKASLDELPQLINVLTGELSLVGPRPHAVSAKAADRLCGEVVDRYFARHKVKPGITGWAQINGWRGETDTEEKIARRVEHDLHYIETWSLWLDIKILARTPLALLKTDNAY